MNAEDSLKAEDALRFIEALLADQGKRLNDVQRAVFRGSWRGKGYKEIHQDCDRVGLQHLMRNVGPELWDIIGEVVGEPVTKHNLQGPIQRAWERQSIVDGNGSNNAASANDAAKSNGAALDPKLQIETVAEASANSYANSDEDTFFRKGATTRQDWDSAPDVSQFFGRDYDLEELSRWITLEGCRLVTVYGVGGVGKTDLSVKLAQKVRDQFECVVWRSLSRWQSQSRPPFPDELLADLIGFLSEQSNARGELSQFMQYLSHHPCLIVLDGFESVLRSGVHDGSYEPGYEGYRELLRRVGETPHQSCLVLTSQEKPREVARLEGETRPVRSWKLEGLRELGGQRIFSAKGEFSGSEADWLTLIRRYDGNPLALNTVATRVWEVFDGKVTDFLEEIKQDPLIFDEICEVLSRQFDRLSELEKTILQCLATHHGPAEVREILQSPMEQLSRMQLQEGLQSLLRRSLIDVESSRYSLHPLMFAYVLNRLD
jgi:hypothetical protein